MFDMKGKKVKKKSDACSRGKLNGKGGFNNKSIIAVIQRKVHTSKSLGKNQET